jgi:hypothetical protein
MVTSKLNSLADPRLQDMGHRFRGGSQEMLMGEVRKWYERLIIPSNGCRAGRHHDGAFRMDL